MHGVGLAYGTLATSYGQPTDLVRKTIRQAEDGDVSAKRESYINTLRPRQDGRHFANDIFKCIFLNENVWIEMKISFDFVPKGSINTIPALVQIMSWRRPGDKPLSEPVMVSLLTHICVTRPQWIKESGPSNGFLPAGSNILARRADLWPVFYRWLLLSGLGVAISNAHNQCIGLWGIAITRSPLCGAMKF